MNHQPTPYKGMLFPNIYKAGAIKISCYKKIVDSYQIKMNKLIQGLWPWYD